MYPAVVERRLRAEFPFVATEAVLMLGVKAGGDRQELHEVVRRHSHEAARRVREEGAANDLFERLSADPLFAPVREEIAHLDDPSRFVGRAPQQVDELLSEHLEPALERHDELAASWPESDRPAPGAVRV